MLMLNPNAYLVKVLRIRQHDGGPINAPFPFPIPTPKETFLSEAGMKLSFYCTVNGHVLVV